MKCGRCLANLALLAALVGSFPVAADDTAAGARVAPEQLEKWLAELDADEYEAREAATQRLSEVGPDAIDVLTRGVISDQAEIAWRSCAALERVAVTGDEQTLARVTAALDKLSAKGKPALKSMAAEMHLRQKRYRHDRAVASLKRNGAIFSDGSVELGAAGMMMPAVGPVAVAIDMDAGLPEAPIIVEEEFAPAPPDAVPAVLVPLEIIGRAFGRAFGLGKPPADEKPADDAPADPQRPDDAAPAEEKPAEVAPPKETPAEAPREEPVPDEVPAPPIEEPAAEPRAEQLERAVEEFRALEREDLRPPAVVAEEEIIEIGGAVILGDGPVVLMDAGFFGGDIGVAEEGTVAASLVLGKQWRGGDEGLAVLKDVPEIWQISIQEAKLTDESLKYIAELPNLSNLQIRRSPFSREALRKLRSAKPSLELHALGEAIMGVNADLGTSPLVLSSVFFDSGAHRAGMRDGDVVTKVDGMGVKDFSDLTISIYGRKEGDKVQVHYERGGEKHVAEVTLKKRPEGAGALQPPADLPLAPALPADPFR